MAEETGETPLSYMLRVMRDAEADEKRRDAMAQAAAPYVHAKLSSVEMDANVTNSYDDMTYEEIRATLTEKLRERGLTPEMLAQLGLSVNGGSSDGASS